MLRIGLVPVFAAALLALPATAAAKEISKLSVCGPSSCASVTDPQLLREWAESSGSGTFGAAPAEIAPYYRLDISVTEPANATVDGKQHVDTWSVYYIPSAGLTRAIGERGTATWGSSGDPAAGIVKQAAAKIDPFPAPAITSVTVGRRTAIDPSSYARLYDHSFKSTYNWPLRNTVTLRLHSSAPSPWTDGKNVLLYSPKEKLLVRDGQVVHLPSSLAHQLARARSLRTTSSHRSAAFAVGIGVAAIALGALAWDRRRRHR